MCFLVEHWCVGNCCFFFFNDTATTEIYTLSLHDALPICIRGAWESGAVAYGVAVQLPSPDVVEIAGQAGYDYAWIDAEHGDRKSTRLNSSHSQISYAVFCLKKKNKTSYYGDMPPRRVTTT